MTSHAAVVARGMGKPCVAGCEALSIDIGARTVRLVDVELAEGDQLTIDGGTGRVIVGSVPLVPPAIDENFGTILGWADEFRRLRVRANADTPEDASKAREFGAEGIGLCRTEHMFMPPTGCLSSRDDSCRRRALAARGARPPAPVQQAISWRFSRRWPAFPVTIRLLDPPLHEFLPLGGGRDPRTHHASDRIRSSSTRRTRCSGHAAAAWGSGRPEIYEMQVRAIVRAARSGRTTGPVRAPLVEIMHPLVGFAEELRRLRELTGPPMAGRRRREDRVRLTGR